MRNVRAMAILTAFAATFAADAATTFKYDALGRVISVSYANGTRIDYTYDANGNRTQVVSGLYANNPPIAGTDSYSKPGASSSTLTVLDNDLDAENQPLTILSVSAPSGGGTATRTAGNTQVSYTAGAVGTETFTYTISDGSGGTDTGTVSVNVTNTAPNAVNDAYNQSSGATATLSVLANDSDPNNQALTISSVTAPSAGGTATRVNNNTQISYTAPNAGGVETFSYTIADGFGGSATATVTITLQAGGIVALNPNLNATSGTNLVIPITQLATLNGNAATINAFTPPTTPACGSRTIAADGQSVTYVPPNYTYNVCVSPDPPPPRVCSVPYTIRKTSNNQDTAGTATISVEARAVSLPDPCP